MNYKVGEFYFDYDDDDISIVISISSDFVGLHTVWDHTKPTKYLYQVPRWKMTGSSTRAPDLSNRFLLMTPEMIPLFVLKYNLKEIDWSQLETEMES